MSKKLLYDTLVKRFALALAKKKGSNVVDIGPEIQELVNKEYIKYIKAFENAGVDIDKLSPSDVKFTIELNEANKLRKKEGIEKALVTTDNIVDMTGKKLDPNEPIIGGTQSNEVLQKSIKKNVEEATKKGDFQGIFNQVLRDPDIAKAFKEAKEAEALADARALQTRPIPLDTIQYQGTDIQKMTGPEKQKYLITNDEQTAELLKKGYTFDDIIYAQDNYGFTAKEIMEEAKGATKKDPFPFQSGGRAGFKSGLGMKFLKFLNENNPVQAYKKYLKSVKDRTLAGKEAEVAGEVIPIAAGGALITNQLKKKLKSMNEEQKQKNNDEMFAEISQEYKEKYKDDPEFLEKMLLSLHENIYMDKKAEGGRIGYKDGPKFNIAATGSKSGKQQIEKAPAGITRDQETFQAIMNADIPLNDKLNFLANLQYGKDRVRIDADDQELALFEGGFKDREFGLGYNEGKEGFSGRVMYNIDTNEPEFKIGFSKKFADGGRAEFKSGLGKGFLNFLKGLTKEKPFSGKEFVEKRKFIGADKIENKINQIKNEKVLKEAQEEFRKNPPVKFPEPGSKEYEEVLARVQRRLMGDRKLNADGGRIGLKAGMSKRAFLKLMGGVGLGIGALKSGILKLAGKEAAPQVAKEVVQQTTKSTPPSYFFELADKIKSLGKPDKVTYADRVEIHRYTGKNGDEYELVEDLSTGDMKITKDKIGGVRVGDDEMVDGIADRSVMEYKKGDVNVDPDARTASKSPDEYDEYKVEFDVDGTEADADNISEFIKKEIIEEVNQQAPKIKKAGGGLAYMLGE